MYRRGEGYTEEWVLHIFIQHQYPELNDTYKKTQYNKLQLTREFTRNWGGSKCSMISPNIIQFIKSTEFVARLTKLTSVAQGLLKWVRLQGRSLAFT